MKKIKKLIIYVVTLGVLTVCLTGCTIKLDDEEYGKIQEIIKTDVNTNEIVDEAVQSFSKIELDENSNIETSELKKVEKTEVKFVDYSIIRVDDGNNYMLVFGYNEDGDVVWKYKTQPSLEAQYGFSFKYIDLDDYSDGVLIYDDCKLKKLDFNTGEVIWSTAVNVWGTSEMYSKDNDKDVIFIYTEESTELCEINLETGEILKDAILADKLYYEKYGVDVSGIKDEELPDNYYEIEFLFPYTGLSVLIVETDQNYNVSDLLITGYEDENGNTHTIVVDPNDFSCKVVQVPSN